MKSEHDLPQSIWVTWERQTRNRSTSQYIGVPLSEIIYQDNPPIVRYVKSIYETVKLIINKKPRYVFIQNPSVVLGLLSLILSKVFRFTFIVDAHNSGINFEGRFKNVVNFLNHIIIKNCRFTIVTNEIIAKNVTAKGGNPLILPDPLPTLPDKIQSDKHEIFGSSKEEGQVIAFCITSWGEDEPVEALISAANRNPSIDFYFTGNYKKSKLIFSEGAIPNNVHLLGFIDESLYFSLLRDCDFTIDLTTRPDCLVCGAYESVSAEKPILLSDSEPQRNYFNKGTVFCETTEEGISSGLDSMVRELCRHTEAIKTLKHDIISMEHERRNKIINSLKK